MRLMPKSRLKTCKGFTLIELLISIAILGILATIGMSTFRNSQMRSRDVQRKANLKQVANALELYYSDYGKYPDAGSGEIKACNDGISLCDWGEGEFTDGKTVYFKKLPKDPTPGLNYFYKLVADSSNQKYQLFARLENSQDQDCIDENCDPESESGFPPACGEETCNFAITSSNTSTSE